MAEQKPTHVEQKPTHVAVHCIQYNDDKGNRVEIAPGTEFVPNKADLEHLQNAGAIKKLSKVAEEKAEAEAKK